MFETIQVSSTQTHVDPFVFKKMITNKGISIAELNNQGLKVLLFFSTTLGCLFVQGIMHDILQIKDQLLKLNTIPVIVHNETIEEVEKILELNENTKKLKDLLFIEKKEFRKDFKVPSITIDKDSMMCKNDECHFKEKQRLQELGLTGFKAFKFPENSTEIPLAACFLIHNSKVALEYRQEKRFERFDIARIVLDTDGYGLKMKSSVFDCKLKKSKHCDVLKMFIHQNHLTKKNSLKDFVTKKLYFGKKSKSLPENKRIQPKDINLGVVLENEHFLGFFKLFATKEYCVENVLFFEEVQEYKHLESSERQLRAKEMLDQFFDEDSINEINCSRNEKVRLFQEYKDFKEDLFDATLSEMMITFYDMFERFQKSEYFDQMLNTKEKNNYLLR
jgi:hypothetical protein